MLGKRTSLLECVEKPTVDSHEPQHKLVDADANPSRNNAKPVRPLLKRPNEGASGTFVVAA